MNPASATCVVTEVVDVTRLTLVHSRPADLRGVSVVATSVGSWSFRHSMRTRQMLSPRTSAWIRNHRYRAGEQVGVT